MMEFTFAGFIGYTFFIVICTWMLTMAFPKIERKKKSENDQQRDNKLKVGGIYGRNPSKDIKNDPFYNLEYEYYVAILDIKPSRDGHCDYCQYVFLNDNMSPYSSYSDTTIFSGITNKFDDWEYIKDIDLDSIVIKR